MVLGSKLATTHGMKALSLLLLLFAGPLLAAPQASGHFERARAYELGRGVTKDHAQAYRLYCLAVRLDGEREAYYALGWMYFAGRGLPRDMDRAAFWLQQGAASGDKVAANLLRRLGEVTPRPDSDCPEPLTAATARDRDQVARWVKLLAPEYDLDPRLVLALIDVESGFDPAARSPRGAVGLMQLMPATAKRFGVSNRLDPMQNLRGGMAYLRWLLDRFDGDLDLALAGYNAGEGAVDRHGGIPPYRETRAYVRRINRLTAAGRPSAAGS